MRVWDQLGAYLGVSSSVALDGSLSRCAGAVTGRARMDERLPVRRLGPHVAFELAFAEGNRLVDRLSLLRALGDHLAHRSLRVARQRVVVGAEHRPGVNHLRRTNGSNPRGRMIVENIDDRAELLAVVEPNVIVLAHTALLPGPRGRSGSAPAARALAERS